MTMHEAAEVLEVTEAMRRLACTERGSRLTRLELEREAAALVAATREAARISTGTSDSFERELARPA